MAFSPLRTAWRTAKATHKVHLANIKFNLDFGPELDKLVALDGKPMPGGQGAAMSKDTETKALAKKCSDTATSYLAKVNAVADNNAKAALTTALKNIKAACDKLK